MSREIELSKNSRVTIEQLISMKNAAIQTANAVLSQAESAADTIISGIDQQLKSRIMSILEANDVPDGDVYQYDPKTRNLVLNEDAKEGKD